MATDVVLEGSAQKQFQKAPKPIQGALRDRAQHLARNPQAGEYVPLAQVPKKATVKKWERRVGRMRNLYKLELPDGWRALYTIGSRGADRIVLVLEVLDHKQYERAMGY